jgi:arylsulfatase A-like enzyme
MLARVLFRNKQLSEPLFLLRLVVLVGTVVPLLAIAYAYIPAYKVGLHGSKQTNRPNVLIVTMDTTRADHLGCYGYDKPTSPFIDSLAQKGTSFPNAYTNATWTLPAHLSLFTGQMPTVHGVGYSNYFASPGLKTLAEILRGQGYVTAGFTGGPFLDSVFNVNQGFHYYDEKLDSGSKLKRLSVFRFLSRFGIHLWDTDGQRDAEETNRSLFPFLDWASKNQPFFVFVNYFDPHEPYNPPEKYRKLLNIQTDFKGNIRFYPLDKKTGVARHKDGTPLTEQEFEALRSLYDGEIRAMDDQVAGLWKKLASLRLTENTLIVLTADHGETIGEHQFLDHGHNLYQEQVRIPLILTGIKKWNSGQRIERPAQIIDLLPTILAELRIPLPEQIQGKNLMGDPAAKFVSAEIDVDPHPRFAAFRREQKMILRGPGKFIESSDKRNLLFHLNEDPLELRNLVNDQPAEAGALEKQLLEYLNGLQAFRHTGGGQMDEETREKLKALGYIE